MWQTHTKKNKLKKQAQTNKYDKQTAQHLLDMGFEPREWWVNIAEEKETGNERNKQIKITKTQPTNNVK